MKVAGCRTTFLTEGFVYQEWRRKPEEEVTKKVPVKISAGALRTINEEVYNLPASRLSVHTAKGIDLNDTTTTESEFVVSQAAALARERIRDDLVDIDHFKVQMHNLLNTMDQLLFFLTYNRSKDQTINDRVKQITILQEEIDAYKTLLWNLHSHVVDQQIPTIVNEIGQEYYSKKKEEVAGESEEQEDSKKVPTVEVSAKSSSSKKKGKTQETPKTSTPVEEADEDDDDDLNLLDLSKKHGKLGRRARASTPASSTEDKEKTKPSRVNKRKFTDEELA